MALLDRFVLFVVFIIWLQIVTAGFCQGLETQQREGVACWIQRHSQNITTVHSTHLRNITYIYIYIQYTLPFQTLEVLKGVLMIYWIGPTIKFNAKANLSTPPMFGLGTLARSPACRWPISWRSWKKIRCSWVSCTA